MEPGENSKITPSFNAATLWIVAFGLCIAFALSHSYSSMAIYDDESYIMMTIKTFLEGDRLYSETYTQYGPAYYMLQQPIHGWMGIPITHDIVRLKTVATWLLIGLICGIVVTRLTGKRLVGIAALLLSVLHLQKLGLEPAHPQEVVALLGMVGLLLMSKQNRGALLLAGVCAAIAGLAKLNAGAVAAAGMLFAAGLANPGKRRFDWLFPVFGAFVSVGLSMGVFVTIAKECSESGNWATLCWPAIIVLSAIAVCVVAWTSRKEHFGESMPVPGKRRFFQPFVSVTAGGIVGSALVLAWAFANGNSIEEIMHGVLLQHGFMAQSFYHPVYVDHLGLLVALATGILLAARFMSFRRSTETRESIDRILFTVAPIVLLIALFQFAMDFCQPLMHGLRPRGAAFFLATAGPAVMPMILLKDRSQLSLTLAMTACLSPLLAFPVPGTQVSLGTLPILLGLIVCTSDSCERLFSSEKALNLFHRRAVFGLFAMTMVATSVFGMRWLNNEALDQPGCQWVRLEPSRAAQEKAVADIIRSTDASKLAFDSHNHNRFFFWTGKRPLTSTSPTFWPAMLTEKQKAKIELAANQADSICVVKLNDERIKLSEYAPLIEHALFDSWTLVEGFGDWQVGLKSGSQSKTPQSQKRPTTLLPQAHL